MSSVLQYMIIQTPDMYQWFVFVYKTGFKSGRAAKSWKGVGSFNETVKYEVKVVVYE